MHVPFCAHRCHYCDFFTIAGRADAHGAYVERLLCEAAAAAGIVGDGLETVFIGGGTPTLLSPPLLARVLEGLSDHLGLAGDVEWTVEANPETVTPECARVLVEGGVTRVSLGAQSFDQGLLDTLERRHDPEGVPVALDRLRAAGCDSTSLDLIFGIPGQTMAQWVSDLEAAVALGVEHLSCYGLVYEPGTPLRRRLESGRVTAVDDGLEAEMYTYTQSYLADAGYAQYEISNWARPGRACRHNLLYWRNASWWALGPSASGHLAPWRWRNVPRLGAWLSGEGCAEIDQVERLEPDARLGEALMLGLRCTAGVLESQVEQACASPGRGPARRRALEGHERAGLIEREAGSIRLTARGMLLADQVLQDVL